MRAPSATLSTAEGRSLTAFHSHLVLTTYIWLTGGEILDFILTFPFSQNASLRHPGLRSSKGKTSLLQPKMQMIRLRHWLMSQQNFFFFFLTSKTNSGGFRHCFRWVTQFYSLCPASFCSFHAPGSLGHRTLCPAMLIRAYFAHSQVSNLASWSQSAFHA